MIQPLDAPGRTLRVGVREVAPFTPGLPAVAVRRPRPRQRAHV